MPLGCPSETDDEWSLTRVHLTLSSLELCNYQKSIVLVSTLAVETDNFRT